MRMLLIPKVSDQYMLETFLFNNLELRRLKLVFKKTSRYQPAKRIPTRVPSRLCHLGLAIGIGQSVQINEDLR